MEELNSEVGKEAAGEGQMPVLGEEPQEQEAPAEQVPPVVSSAPEATTPAQEVAYASFGKRFLATIIDFASLMFLGAILGRGGCYDGSCGVNVGWEDPLFWVFTAYVIIMDVKFGGPLGKIVMNIRIQDKGTAENTKPIKAILRETVGKYVSAFVVFLGFFWMLWDKEKQTWHDKLANSVVVKK